MFGKNPTRKRSTTHDGNVLAVQGAPWRTIQGEGPFAGRAATFIRLWGCHLQCFFCDTDFESDERGTRVDALVDSCIGPDLVVLTGGEPMRQNIVPLCKALFNKGHTVQIETAGSFWWPALAPFCAAGLLYVVVSPKTPTVHKELRASAWKYIISATDELDDLDGLPRTNTQNREGVPKLLARPFCVARDQVSKRVVYVQPMDEQDPVKNQANLDLCVRLVQTYDYTLSLQQHKIIGVA